VESSEDGIVFKTFRFLRGHVETEAFKNGAKKSVSIFGRFTVDDRRKRIKKYAFSNKKAFLWTGENKRKTLIGRKYFASVWLIRRRILLKEQALLWPGPNTFCSFYGRWRM